MKRRKFVQLASVGLVTVTTAGCVGENVEEPEDTDGTTPDTQPPAGDETGGVSEDDGGTTGNNEEDGSDQREIEEPDPQEFSGSGQDVVTFTAQGGMTVLDTQHNGDANFQVEVLDSGGGLVDIPVNVIGDWEGSNAMGLPQGEYAADINADGSWELVVRQPRETEGQSLPVNESGRNSDVFGPVEFEGLAEVEGEHDGDSNFQVEVLNINGQLIDILFNEIGQFEGATTFSANGPGYVQVNSEGEWTISIS
jgi:hypothetical protein